MPFWTSGDDSPDELRTRTPDGRDLVFLAGTAIFSFKGSGQNWRFDDALHLVGPVWRDLDDVAATAALASSRNDNVANNYGLAVDNCRWSNYNSRILLTCALAVRDSDAYLFRFAYQVTAIGLL